MAFTWKFFSLLRQIRAIKRHGASQNQDGRFPARYSDRKFVERQVSFTTKGVIVIVDGVEVEYMRA